MAKFEVSVTLVIEAEDDCEAYYMAKSAMDNMIYGSILAVDVGGVNDLTPKLELTREEKEALANISVEPFRVRGWPDHE